MPDSPNVLNYQYGAGSAYLKVDDVDVAYRHLGNAPEISVESEFTTLEHKQTMSGLKSTDLEITTEVSSTVNITLDEVTPENMALFASGTVVGSSDGGLEVGGLTLTNILGYFRYVSDNPYGQEFVFDARVSIKPNGAFNFITDDLTQIPLTMKVLQAGGKFGNWEFPGGSA
jgi:hypothetical protein